MKNTLTLLFSAILINNMIGQDLSPVAISSAGSTFHGTNMQIDWTVGELAIPTIQNLTHQITQGFHQPNYIITSMKDLPRDLGQIQVYPNPTSEIINIEIDFQKSRNVKILLNDLNGIPMWTAEGHGMQIHQVKNLSNLPSGSYVLNFEIDKNRYSKIFKIQKLN